MKLISSSPAPDRKLPGPVPKPRFSTWHRRPPPGLAICDPGGKVKSAVARWARKSRRTANPGLAPRAIRWRPLRGLEGSARSAQGEERHLFMSGERHHLLEGRNKCLAPAPASAAGTTRMGPRSSWAVKRRGGWTRSYPDEIIAVRACPWKVGRRAQSWRLLDETR